VSNKIFDDDHTATILSIGYSQFEGDPRKFRIVCPSAETLDILSKCYPGTLVET
jgi:hypothetical protein